MRANHMGQVVRESCSEKVIFRLILINRGGRLVGGGEMAGTFWAK